LLPSCNLPLSGSKEAARDRKQKSQITVRRAPTEPRSCRCGSRCRNCRS
jgi:hypothetical protein